MTKVRTLPTRKALDRQSVHGVLRDVQEFADGREVVSVAVAFITAEGESGTVWAEGPSVWALIGSLEDLKQEILRAQG